MRWVIGAQGVTRIARDRMAALTADDRWTLESYAFDEIEMATPAPNIAIIAYIVRQKVTTGGKTQDMRAADCSTWIRGRDGWECHAHSETFLKA